MRRGNSPSIRLAMGAALATATACGRVIVLGDSESPICFESCGSGGQSGSGGMGGALAGASAQAGTTALPTAGTGGGSVSPSGGAGNDGGVAGAAGDGPVPDCEPSAEDARCDGLDEACQITTDDRGCSNACKGTYVRGSSYMSCIASRDFDQAEAACQANGMHLVKVDDALENATVLSLALDDYVWIGGSNRDDVDVYRWLDGTQFLSAGAAVGNTYQNFGTSEPAPDTKLRCVQLRESTGGTWSNWQCSGMQSFVCERYTF
jgi:hypothetical protein